MAVIEARHRLGGTWSDAGVREEVRSPADLDRVLGSWPRGGAQEVEAAVAAAAGALAAWRRLPGPERGQRLFEAAQALEAHRDELAELAAREMGKPIGEARGEAARAVALFRYYGGEGSRAVGEVIPSQRAGTLQYTVRVPVGVVGVITPWNFPLAIPAWKIAPALAYGNTVVFKPAEWSTLTAHRLVEIVAPHLPDGVLNMVCGTGGEAGEALVRHEGVHAVTFTGSVGVGRRIAEIALARGAKYQLEMGGKNPVIVDADADLELAADLTLSGAMRSAGQKCTATSRAIVLAQVRDAFRDALVRRMRELAVGDPLDPATYLGPVVSRPQYDKVLSAIERGRAEGARLVAGGGPHGGDRRGYFVAPTLFEDVAPSMSLFQEEIFGPVLGITVARDLDEAIAQANAVRYGLSASVFTRRLDVALRCVEELEVGLVRVNEETAGVELQAPFGGVKASSSHSREQGRAAIEFFTHVRTVAIRPS
jgi:acyl-CoA reductase-like NAD-dependent aldehyde dehydrogenase